MKERLDTLLVDLGYFETREKAKREILLGNVLINDKLETKAGTQFNREKIHSIFIKNKLNYVSRGGLKLEGAIKEFSLDFNNKVVLDIGASTGGFTDCSLQNGASLVYAVDVGYNQLAYSLRVNEKVVVMEKTHIKDLKIENLTEKIDIVVTDVSFISVTKVLDEINRLEIEKAFNKNFEIVLLIKPQFELTKEKIGKNGIVEKEEYRQEAIQKVIHKIKEYEYTIDKLVNSPIKGTKGNIEYLIHLTR